ncbi:MAG: PKD domain-containing protein [Candidatus Saccharimonadales bacterium]
MKLLSKIATLSNKTLVLSSVTAALVVGVLGFAFSSSQAQNISIGGPSDCDSNAVMYCGAHTVNSVISKYRESGSVKNIYAHFGISSADIEAMNNPGTKVVAGTVTKSGNVLGPNGGLLATNAKTAGRDYMPNSNKVTRNGTTFYTRHPSASFASNSLQAFIVLDQNGNFKFAILAACGNPVTATPQQPKKPGYTLQKEVKVKGTENFKKNVTVKSGTHVIYRITVKSVGQAPVQNMNIRDNLPAHVQYVNGTLKRDGQVLTGQADRFFSNGLPITNIAPNDSRVFTFEAIVGPNDKPATCKDERLNNVAKVAVPELPNKDDNAVVNKNCKPVPPKKPTFACVNLQAIGNNRLTYTFKAKASAANGAKINAYRFNFGDGKIVTVNSKTLTATTKHTYANLDTAKTYNARVTVIATVNGNKVEHTAPACTATVKVAPKPPQPPKQSAECKSLTLKVTSKRTITATTTVDMKNGAKLVSINYNFDDGQTLLVNNLNPVTHTYAEDGDYVVTANVTFNVDGKNVNSECQAPISFIPNTPPPTCEEEYGPEACEETPTCEELAAQDKSIVCEEVVSTTSEEVPTELANTGPGSVAAVFGAVSVLGAVGYRTLLRRRLNQ